MSTRKVAAAEGMPEINRRTALVAGANLALSSAIIGLAVSPSEAVEPEHPWVKARRLARELSNALAQCDEGRSMAYIYPASAGYHSNILFGDMGGSAEHRLEFHAKAYSMAARDIDPTATSLWMGRAVDDSNPQRFNVVVVREG
ncbi:hypothetical protein [Aminobacter niigataensis]|uniref:hypothetical protein n=1 Tax=Aminobacter niigataensis TaxID=83265 RepID=UPI0024CA071C|nr:hypothetical protein [Aminobacter niigataensis]CAI2932470.1 conserved protein of unknown function [Aminobacter niigataensis]